MLIVVINDCEEGSISMCLLLLLFAFKLFWRSITIKLLRHLNRSIAYNTTRM